MDGNVNKKDRRRKMTGGSKKMSSAVERDPGRTMAENEQQAKEMEEGLSPNLQAHIGRQVREAFDKVAREPIPEHLLRLLKDLERSGGK